MNQLNAVIKSVDTEDHISLIVAQAAGIDWYALMIDDTDAHDYIQPGKAVTLLFKENAVSLAKDTNGLISIRNRIPCSVSNLQTGNVLSVVSLDCKGHTFTSVITTHAVKELNLQTGDYVEAMIKTTDISLQQPDS